MGKVIRRLTTVMLAVILAVAFMPAGFGMLGVDAPGVEKAYAGGSVDLGDPIEGVSSGDTITPGQTLLVKMSTLDTIYEGDFSYAYNQGYVDAYFSVDGNKVATTKDSTGFSYTVKSTDAGKKLRFETETTGVNYMYDSYYNNMTAEYTIGQSFAHIVRGPNISGVQYSYGLTDKNIVVKLSGYGEYYTDTDPTHKYVDKKTIKLYCNGKLIGTKSTEGSSLTFAKVPVKYNAASTVKVAIYMEIESKLVYGYANTYTIPGDKLGKNTVYATKISKNKAIVKWSGVTGASGYYVYMGSKKIKTLSASKRSYTVSKKKAGSKKYKVVPYYKSYKGTSNVAKPKANKRTWRHSMNPDSYRYAEGNFVVTKLQLKGKYYYVTGYAVNNRIIFKLAKYKKLSFKVYVDGKVVMKKTYKNKKVNAKHGTLKKMTFKIKGKANKDLVNSSVSVSVGYSPVWK